jgi:hypothetical protein
MRFSFHISCLIHVKRETRAVLMKRNVKRDLWFFIGFLPFGEELFEALYESCLTLHGTSRVCRVGKE